MVQLQKISLRGDCIMGVLAGENHDISFRGSDFELAKRVSVPNLEVVLKDF